MSHYSSAPRKNYIMLHHTGAPNSHTSTSSFCSSGYDFTVNRDGRIHVCSWWDDASGRANSGCYDTVTSIHMTGCFGGCSYGNVSGPSKNQECSVAYLIAHLKTPDYAHRIRPHAYCAHWNPDGHPSPLATRCCGHEFTTNSSSNYSWSSKGLQLRDRIRKRRQNWDDRACCDPWNDHCPI